MQYEYFIFENICNSSQLSRIIPAQILKIPTHQYKFNFHEGNGDGGYKSIEELRKKSPIFKRISRTNSKLANKILDLKNIETVKGFHFDEVNNSYSVDYIGLFDHMNRGRIKRKDIQGIHIFDPSLMKVIKFGRMNISTLVWEAQIAKYDKTLNRWVTKKRMSNFFPIHCSSQCLFKQCSYAYDNKIKIDGSNGKYKSSTKCGIPVILIVDEKSDNTKTMYPELE
ncbi:EndoU domain-containing protein [Ancylomarina sp. DW003]|nr:EndoU domain-containing protein [Ancylomarina sp. DW003]MDE5421823.1 EndoU domain-containing protein [Ancylomarina sp. DW003]